MKPPKQHVNLKFLVWENVQKNSKRALRADTAHNKCLEEALNMARFDNLQIKNFISRRDNLDITLL